MYGYFVDNICPRCGLEARRYEAPPGFEYASAQEIYEKRGFFLAWCENCEEEFRADISFSEEGR